MAVEREEDYLGNVSYKDSSGDSHYSEYDANQADQNKQAAMNAFNLGGGSKGKDFTDYAMEWAIKAFIFGPILFAKVVSWIWAKLLDFGFPGRVITTALMFIVGPLILLFPVMMLGSMGGGGPSGLLGAIITIVMAVFTVGAGIIPAAWYYIWHYDAVKLMGATVFSRIIQNFAKFFWFGFIGAGLISLASPGFGGFLALAVSAAGFIYYFKATKEYRQEAKENPSMNFSTATKSIIMTVVLVILAGTGVLTTLSVVASGIKSRIEATKLATEAEKYKDGMYAEVIYDYETSINSKVDGSATSVIKVNKGNILTVTGKAVKDAYDTWYIPVEFEGEGGFIRMRYIEQTNKRPPPSVR